MYNLGLQMLIIISESNAKRLEQTHVSGKNTVKSKQMKRQKMKAGCFSSTHQSWSQTCNSHSHNVFIEPFMEYVCL